MFTIVFPIVLGSLIGFLATLASTQISSQVNKKSKEKSFKISIKLELRDTIKIIDEIKSQQNKQEFYDYIQLKTLDMNIENLQGAKKSIHLIKDESIQADLYTLIGKLSTLGADMRSTQDYDYNNSESLDEDGQKSKDKLIDKKRNRHAMEMIEIRREAEDLSKKLN